MADKKEKIIAVNVIKTAGEAALVEWNDGKALHRATIPAASVIAGEANAEVLDMGIPHGLPWEKIITLKATPALIAAHLRNMGIWTLEDARARVGELYGVFQAVYGTDVGNLLEAASNYVEEANHA